MSIIQQIRHVKSMQQSGVIVFGSFDGVHRGHQDLVNYGKKLAQVHSLTLIIIVLGWPSDKSMLTNKQNKLALIQKIAPQAYIVYHDLTIDYQFYSPQKFIHKIINFYFKPKYIVVGDNFRFGYQHAGNIATLKQFASQYNYKLHNLKTSLNPVSSNLTRSCINKGDMIQAAQILGRYWWIECKVICGAQKSHIYPSANLDIHKYVAPARGVYLTYAKIIHNDKIETWYPALSYFGKAPTIINRSHDVLEVHLLRQRLNLYHLTLRVLFLELLRPDQKFTCRKMLDCQIKDDISKAEHKFKKLNIDWHKYDS